MPLSAGMVVAQWHVQTSNWQLPGAVPPAQPLLHKSQALTAADLLCVEPPAAFASLLFVVAAPAGGGAAASGSVQQPGQLLHGEVSLPLARLRAAQMQVRWHGRQVQGGKRESFFQAARAACTQMTSCLLARTACLTPHPTHISRHQPAQHAGQAHACSARGTAWAERDVWQRCTSRGRAGSCQAPGGMLPHGPARGGWRAAGATHPAA